MRGLSFVYDLRNTDGSRGGGGDEPPQSRTFRIGTDGGLCWSGRGVFATWRAIRWACTNSGLRRSGSDSYRLRRTAYTGNRSSSARQHQPLLDGKWRGGSRDLWDLGLGHPSQRDISTHCSAATRRLHAANRQSADVAICSPLGNYWSAADSRPDRRRYDRHA